MSYYITLQGWVDTYGTVHVPDRAQLIKLVATDPTALAPELKMYIKKHDATRAVRVQQNVKWFTLYGDRTDEEVLDATRNYGYDDGIEQLRVSRVKTRVPGQHMLRPNTEVFIRDNLFVLDYNA